METLLEIVKALGERSELGALLALLVIAGVVGVIMIARGRQLFEDAAAEKRKSEFQTVVLREIEVLRERERQLHAEMADLRAANSRLLEGQGEMLATMTLMREQLRRLIEQVRDVRDGKLSLDAVDLPEAAV